MFKDGKGSPSQQKGLQHEDLALDFLQSKGLILLEKNFHSRAGELDLIMRDGETIVFAEVRFRKHSVYGSAIESIGYHKQQKIIKTAKIYLLKYGLYNAVSSRFDVVGISGSVGNFQYQWLKNAFY